MIPKKLNVTNFAILSSLEINFDSFSSAIVLARIGGDGRKSNGGGKTTITAALNYVLFDILPFSPIEKNIRDGQDQLTVVLEFESSDQSKYQITRSRRRKSKQAEVLLKKWDGNSWSDKTQKTNSETEREIRKLIGFSYDIFRNTNFFGQSDLSGFMSAKTPGARKTILENVFQLEIWQALEKLAAQEIIKELEKQIFESERDLINLKNPSKDLEQLSVQIELEQNKIIQLENELQAIVSNLGEKNQSLLQIKLISNSDLSNKLIQLNQKKEKNILQKRKIFELQKLAEEKQKSILFSEKQIAENQSENYNINLQIEKETKKQLRSSEEFRQELEKSQKNENNGKTLVARLEAEVRQKEKQNLPEKETCPECYQQISCEYREKHQAEKDAELNRLRDSLEDYRKKLSAVSTKKSSLERQWQETLVSENNLQIWRSKQKMLQKQIANLEETKQQQAEFLSQIESEKEHKKKEISDLEQEISSLEQEIQVLQSTNKEAEIKKLQQEIALWDEKLKRTNQNLLESKNSLAVLSDNFTRRSADQKLQETINLLLQEKRAELEIAKLVHLSFGSEGIPRTIIAYYLPRMEAKINFWLKQLKPEFSIWIDPENFDLIFKLQNKERDYDQISQGQKFITMVAFKLGLRDLLKEVFQFQCSLLEFDEVDQSFDENTTQIYIDLLKELQKSFKILVIAHNDLLKEKFTHAVVLESNGVDCATGQLVAY